MGYVKAVAGTGEPIWRGRRFSLTHLRHLLDSRTLHQSIPALP